MYLCRSLLIVVVISGMMSIPARSDPAAELKPLMTERGKLLFSEDFDKPLGKEWFKTRGQWEVIDAATRGTRTPDDKFNIAILHNQECQNVVIQYSFKLEGSKATSFWLDDPKAHLCRISITPTYFSVKKEKRDAADTAVNLDMRTMPIQDGEWHTLLIEMLGKEIVVQLDGKAALGSHEALDVKKVRFGINITEQSVSFKSLRMWEALPGKAWETTKAKLIEERARAKASKK